MAAGRPFLYFPLHHHFEQNFHVRAPAGPLRRRPAAGLVRRHAGRVAAAVVEELGRTPAYRPVESDGAARTADLLSDLF